MLKKLGRSEFAKQVATLLSGSALAQLLPFIAEPFITRLYSAEELGIITLFTSVAVMFSIVATGRYEFAIMLPKADKESINLMAVSILFTFFVTFVSFLVVWFLRDWVSLQMGNKTLSAFLWMVPFSVMIVGFYNTFNQWANRKAYHKWMATSRLAESGTSSGLNVLFGYLKWGSFGLVLAYLFGQVLANFPLFFPFFKKDRTQLKLINWDEMRILAKKYKKFPTTNSLHAFTDMFFLSLLVFLISHYFGNDVTGYFGRTYKILLVPSILIGGAIGQIFFRKISIMKSSAESMIQFYKKIVVLLFGIGLPVFVLIMVFGENIFTIYLGDNFAVAGLYAAILAPWIWMKFVTGPLAMVPVVFNKLNTSFYFSVVTNIFLIVAIVAGGSLNWPVKYAFALLSGLQIIVLGIYIVWTWTLVRNYSHSIKNTE
jgi:O-antigen/teichoic acid export membrane protein